MKKKYTKIYNKKINYIKKKKKWKKEVKECRKEKKIVEKINLFHIHFLSLTIDVSTNTSFYRFYNRKRNKWYTIVREKLIYIMILN